MADSLNTLHVERTRKGPFTEVFINLDPRLPGMPAITEFRKYGVEWTKPSDIDVAWVTAQVAEYRSIFRRSRVLRTVNAITSAVGGAVEQEFTEIIRLLYNGLESAPNATAAQALAYVEANRTTAYLNLEVVFPDIFALLVRKGLAATADWSGLRDLLNDVRDAGGPM